MEASACRYPTGASRCREGERDAAVVLAHRCAGARRLHRSRGASQGSARSLLGGAAMRALGLGMVALAVAACNFDSVGDCLGENLASSLAGSQTASSFEQGKFE